jgi:hypothetical protein
VSIICWGLVMFLFEANKSSLQPSLSSSMQFLYKDSDVTRGWRDFVPIYIPENYTIRTKQNGIKQSSTGPAEVPLKVPKLN